MVASSPEEGVKMKLEATLAPTEKKSMKQMAMIGR